MEGVEEGVGRKRVDGERGLWLVISSRSWK